MRFEERKRREDESPRLSDEVPELQTLCLALDEFWPDGTMPAFSHTRHIVVARAPALFHVVCGNRDCVDGGYELTYEVMRKLRDSSGAFGGETECLGQLKGAACRRRLSYRAQATYRA